MKLKFPHTYVIIFSLIMLAAVLTWIFPGGDYIEQTKIVDGKEVKELVFQPLDSSPQTWQVLSAMFKGFVRQSGIIVLILMIGGAFWIMNSTKALDTGIVTFIGFTRKLERFRFFKMIGVDNVIIVLIMLMFSLFGSIFGMSEESIAFVIILVPLAISMGYDSIVGLCMCYLAAHIGFAAAMLNPFTIGIAQGIAGLPLFSGLEYRFFCFIVINIVGIGFVLWYARKIRKNPEKSPVYKVDAYWRDKAAENTETVERHTPVSAWISYGLSLAALSRQLSTASHSGHTFGNRPFCAGGTDHTSENCSLLYSYAAAFHHRLFNNRGNGIRVVYYGDRCAFPGHGACFRDCSGIRREQPG
jgi:uncharacterized ion transporter superfamily protein YfcC